MSLLSYSDTLLIFNSSLIEKLWRKHNVDLMVSSTFHVLILTLGIWSVIWTLDARSSYKSLQWSIYSIIQYLLSVHKLRSLKIVTDIIQFSRDGMFEFHQSSVRNVASSLKLFKKECKLSRKKKTSYKFYTKWKVRLTTWRHLTEFNNSLYKSYKIVNV